MNIAYLATPYTHHDPKVMEARYLAVTEAAAYFFTSGQPVFSPITHTHPIKVAGGGQMLTSLFSEWAEYDYAMIRLLCSHVLVLTIDGWRESVGVQAEIKYATRLGKEVKLIVPESIGLLSVFPYLPPR